jgi:hypothetical protein
MSNDFLNRRKSNNIAQRKFRAERNLAGYKRLDIYIPPELWAKLQPHLEPYGGEKFPGYALVKFLKDVEFSDE